jgi:hypothetical protein
MKKLTEKEIYILMYSFTLGFMWGIGVFYFIIT